MHRQSEVLTAVERHARSRSRTIALAGNAGSLRYGELPIRIESRARELEAAGCRVVGLLMDNGPDWVLWDLAAVLAGIVCVPIPGFFSAEQRRHVIAAAGIDHLIAEHGIHPTGIAAEIQLPADTAKITFTSGTTGSPKGVCLSRAGLEQVAESIVATVGVRDGERHLSVLPLGILLENVAGVFPSLLAGGTLIVPGMTRLGFAQPFRPDFSRLAQVFDVEEIGSAILVPELLRGLSRRLTQEPRTLKNLRFLAVGGAKIAPELILYARSLGLPVYEGYGLSECGSVIALNTPEYDDPGSAGRLLPHVEAAEVDGEIVIRNPAFLGYLGEPCRNGSFATGDLGSIDADRFVHLRGRARNVIITSFGRNVSPEWIESRLLEQPEIFQAIVFGEGMPHLGALIVPSGKHVDVSAAIERTNRELPDYARIQNQITVPPFTGESGLLTANGRPRRDAILGTYRQAIYQEDSDELLRSTGR